MEKDKIFFASFASNANDIALTTTSANHIANMAKECYKATESKLDDVEFYTTEISLLIGGNTRTLKKGVEDFFLAGVRDNLLKIAQLKSLIAWLREGIKAKDRLIAEARNLTRREVAEKLGITLPNVPEKYTRLSEDDVIATWNIAQRNRYYYLDTLCSTFGGYIHPGEAFAEAKERLSKALNEAVKSSGTGRETVLYSYIPTVSEDDVEETFFALQNEYRGYQAELNSLKHQIEVALQEDDREKSQKELLEAQAYRDENSLVEAQIADYKREALKVAQSLKIVIPNSLKSIYETISKIGK